VTGQLKPQTPRLDPEMTPKYDNTVAHITDRIDEACRELTKIADMLAGYPELDDTRRPPERGAGDPRGAARQIRSRPPKIARSLRLDWPAENRARPPAPQVTWTVNYRQSPLRRTIKTTQARGSLISSHRLSQ
jgi:hypothetical protein